MRSIFTLLLFSSLTALTAQTYQPVLQDERSWWGFVNVVDICNRAAYELAGDTVIYGTTYRSVN